MEKKKGQPMTREEFMHSIRFDSYLFSDAQKNFRWKASREHKELIEFENIMRFTRLQKLNKPNNFLIEYLGQKVRENYFNKFNEIYWADKALQNSFTFCKELLKEDHDKEMPCMQQFPNHNTNY